MATRRAWRFHGPPCPRCCCRRWRRHRPYDRTATPRPRSAPAETSPPSPPARCANQNAFNSFPQLQRPGGNTTNLQLPAGTSNLINIVRDERSQIDGQAQRGQGRRIGGNVYFANPKWRVVGPTGVNVGSLECISTPTRAFADSLFRAPGQPDDAAVGQLMDGKAPRNPAATVSVQAASNASDGVQISAGSIQVGGTVHSGARFVGSAPDPSQGRVNANGLASGSAPGGARRRILLVADGDVQVLARRSCPAARRRARR